MKKWLPILIAVMVMLGVVAGYVTSGVRQTRKRLEQTQTPISSRVNVLFALSGSAGEARALCVVSANPRNGSITLLPIPVEIAVDIAGSAQTLKTALSIGGADMLMEKLQEKIPLSLAHYVVIDSQTLSDITGQLGVESSSALKIAQSLSTDQFTEEMLRKFLERVKTDFSVYAMEQYIPFLQTLSFRDAKSMKLPGSYATDGSRFSVDTMALNELIGNLLQEN